MCVVNCSTQLNSRLSLSKKNHSIVTEFKKMTTVEKKDIQLPASGEIIDGVAHVSERTQTKIECSGVAYLLQQVIF